MTQHKFSVNSQSVVGTLTWYPIATLETLAITDPFYGAGNQTCSYTHDDISRIASVNCGSPWNQTFAYDAFGNISKSGTISFQPTYSYLTNRMTQIGSSTPTYDANGNVLNDTAHTYTWDANGRPVTVDTVGLTYDALGRMVEQNRSGVYTEIAYGPNGGKLAIMSGQTLQKGFVPLAGGSVAVYNSSGLAYYRHSDWLGSSRFASTPARAMYFDGAYAPFGENYAQTGTTDLSFTGMNQDTVANLFDFPAREYNAIHGRWPSPDPAGLVAANTMGPQSWNRYSYVLNCPLDFLDPLGLVCVLNGEIDNQIDQGGCTAGGGTWYGDAPPITSDTCAYCSDSDSNSDSNSEPDDGNIGSLNVDYPTGTVTLGGSGNGAAPWYKNACITSALGAGALSAGIDAIGFIPEAGGVARMIGHGAGYVGVVADKVGSTVVNAIGKTAGTVNSAAGVSSDWTSWVSAAITVGDFIPVVNEFTTVAALSWDAGVAAYKVYQCPK